MFIIYLFLFNLTSYVISSSVSRADYGEVKLFQKPVSYDVDTTVILNEASRRDKEVSYKVKAALNVIPVWKGSEFEYLLKFELASPHLLSREKHVNADYMFLKSVWDSYSYSTFYAHWKFGQIQESYLDPNELVEIQNFKRSLISLFQFQVFDGENNETDISGVCDVQYETLSMHTIRKIKRRCKSAGWSEGEEEEAGEVESRRLTRYTLNSALDALDELHAEELYSMGAAAAGAGLKTRVWMRLTRRDSTPVTVALAATPLDALPPKMRTSPLIIPPPDDLHDDLEPEDDLSEAVAEGGEEIGEEAGEGGTVESARAMLRLLAAVRHAAPAQLDKLLHDRADPKQLSSLCAALGLVGSATTHAAAARFLRFRQRDVPHRLALVYFSAFALSDRPQESAVTEILQLGEKLQDAALAQSALLAGAAAASRCPSAAAAVRVALSKALAKCKDDPCKSVHIHALGNLRRDDTADLLLEHAESGAGPAALAALDALEAAPRALREPARLARIERLALNARAPFELRAAALDLLLCVSAPAPFALPRVLIALHDAGPRELALLAWRRLRALSVDHPHVPNMLAILPPRLRGWDVHAFEGTSSVLVREAGAADGYRALLESVQVARAGLLRRGRVHLLTLSPDNATDETLSVEIWTKGLQAFTGESKESAADEDDQGSSEEEAASGGLALAVGGARMRSVTLFDGQAELLGHVWAGTGSEPTAVLRAVRALRGAHAARPLLGGATLSYGRRALLALALDAQAQVSLWSRAARAALELRGALAARGAARVRSAGGTLLARASVATEPRLSIAADLDFYNAVALCIRVHTADNTRSYNVTLTSELGAAHRRVRRTRARVTPAAGRTLALDARNDRTCASTAARD